MSCHNRRSALLRQARFESFEERLALSVQPVADFYLTTQVEQRVEMHLEQIEQHLEELQDLDSSQAGEISHHTRQLDQHLGDVHDTTGVNYSYNTYGFTGAGQTVAVIDSGIAWDHVALGGGLGTGYRVVGGWDFAENDADPYDDGPAGFHGTHVTGIIGSSNSTYRGVAPDVDIVGLRVFDDDGAGYFSWVESALQWVHDHRNDFANPITTVNMSLGTAWNSDSIPNWSTIEDELAQLEQDGIFIAVSAGNSFADYNTPGLSYPAASQYVVPVASVTNAGSFSTFSQRHDRVIAAPGSSITSTVPDHVFGADGNPNDFGAASGTSMASPYVAGASVLIRQAMEFVGIQNITQDTIYDQMRDTADIFYDTATNASYHRLNVQAALDALMPTDDYGSDAASANDLGTLSGSSTFSGLIGTTADQDFFTFTAGVTGTISFTFDTTNGLALDAQVVSGGATFDNNVLSFAVTAGQSYTFSLAANQKIGFYDVSVECQAISTNDGTMKEHVTAEGDVFTLSSDGWIRRNGQKMWGNTRNMHVTESGTVYWHSTSGSLWRLPEGGRWERLESNAVEFHVDQREDVYTLRTDGWLCLNGRQMWGNTRDMHVTETGTVYWHSTGGGLWRLPKNGTWERLETKAVKFQVDDAANVYAQRADGWISLNGKQMWGHTRDMDVRADGSVYWLSTSGSLWRLPASGSWSRLETNVTRFDVHPDGTVYSLSGDGWLRVDGVGTLNRTHDFALNANHAVYRLAEDGLLQRLPCGGTWESCDSQVTKFAVRADGAVVRLKSDGHLMKEGDMLGATIQDIRIDALGRLVMEDESGGMQYAAGQFSKISRTLVLPTPEIAAVEQAFAGEYGGL